MHDINRSEKYSLSIYLKVLCILVLSFPVLLLADEYDVSGIIESINSHDVQPISETHIILLASMEEKLVLDDPDSPWHGATGPCGGAVEIKEGAINGSGYCTFTDKDNDKFVIS